MKEADRKRALVAKINALEGGYARRIEDRFAVGVLDLIFKLPGLPWVWAEGKMIEGNLFAPTERQFVEGERIIAVGGIAILIGWKDKQTFVSPWVEKADIRTSYSTPDPVNSVGVLRNYLTWRRQEKLDGKEEE